MLTYILSTIKSNLLTQPVTLQVCFRFFSIVGQKSNQINLTSDQESYVLQRLNEATKEQLTKYSMPRNRLKTFEEFRIKNGNFKSLNDVLVISGMGVKTLNKLCKNILLSDSEINVMKDNKSNKLRGQFITPHLTIFQTKDLKTAVGLHLFATGISWAKVAKAENELTNWSLFDFNLGNKKLNPADALQLAVKICNEIPTSDVYIFEALPSVTPTAQQSQLSVGAYVQKIQILSMLIALLSTNIKHNPDYLVMSDKFQDMSVFINPKVYFLRQRLAARLFKTLVGTERVASATTVSNILQKTHACDKIYTPIKTNEELRIMFNEQLPVIKEVLGQALFLTMAFMDLCVYQNSESIKAVSSHKS